MEFFKLGKNFASVADVKDHVKEYERTHLINLYIQDSRRLESARKKAPKRYFSDELEFGLIITRRNIRLCDERS